MALGQAKIDYHADISSVASVRSPVHHCTGFDAPFGILFDNNASRFPSLAVMAELKIPTSMTAGPSSSPILSVPQLGIYQFNLQALNSVRFDFNCG